MDEVTGPSRDPLREMLVAEMNQLPEIVKSNSRLQHQRALLVREQRKSLARRLSDLGKRRTDKKGDDGQNAEFGSLPDVRFDPECSRSYKLHSKLSFVEDLNQNFVESDEKVPNPISKEEKDLELCNGKNVPKIIMRRIRSSNSWSIGSDQDTQVEKENVPKIYMRRIGSSWSILK